MGYALYETNFNNPTVKLACIYFEIAYAKNRKKQTFKNEVTRQNFSTVINKKSRFNGSFNSNFDDFLQLHSLILYEYNELIRSSFHSFNFLFTPSTPALKLLFKDLYDETTYSK
ncbi:hypothetical protein DVH24_028819 [Malus domestica]|uniref:Uncharacterized protein n=1 Tax=Malus domestica TaxID=3750 RepID=A0A498IVE2_MALDO|nr:hypothetical protein DVH24_028819 [Malus domestica]